MENLTKKIVIHLKNGKTVDLQNNWTFSNDEIKSTRKYSLLVEEEFCNIIFENLKLNIIREEMIGLML